MYCALLLKFSNILLTGLHTLSSFVEEHVGNDTGEEKTGHAGEEGHVGNEEKTGGNSTVIAKPGNQLCVLAACKKPKGCELAAKGVGCESKTEEDAPKRCKTCIGNFTLDANGMCHHQKCEPGENKNPDGGCDVVVCKKPKNCAVPQKKVAVCEGKDSTVALCETCLPGYASKKGGKVCDVAKCKLPKNCAAAKTGIGCESNATHPAVKKCAVCNKNFTLDVEGICQVGYGHASTARLLTLGIQSQEPRVMNSTEDMVHHRGHGASQVMFVCECM